MPPPDSVSAGPRKALLVSPPLEEYARTLRAFVGLGAHLEAKGFSVARWSSAERRVDRSEELVVAELGASVAEALHRSGGESPAVVGLRFGAYLAIRALAQGHAARAVLWEPVTDPRQYVRELVRVALANQLTTYGTVRFSAEMLLDEARRTGYFLVDGYRLSQASLDDLEKAPEVTPESVADSRQSLSLIFWRSKRTFERWRDSGFDAVFLPTVRLAWDNIRFFDSNPVALYDATLERLQR